MAGGLTGKQMAAFAATSGGDGLPAVIFTEAVSALVAGTSSTVMTIKGRYRILGVWAHCLAASGGATLQLSRTRAGATVDISDAMACGVLDLFTQAASIDNTYINLQHGDKLVIKAAGNALSGRVIILAVRTEE